MYSAERQQEILKLIEEYSRVSVAELAARFDVSESSIRRDLNELHRLGMVQRTYGGAIGYVNASSEVPFSERVVSRHDEKERIGRAAAHLVQPGDTIFVDGGTTTECMLSYLPVDAPLTVVTYGLNIVQRLIDQRTITLVLIGGILHVPTLTFGGVFAADSFECFSIRFDKAFIAATGVSAEAGSPTPASRKSPSNAGRCAVPRDDTLGQSAKVGVIAAGVIAPIDQLQRLITTREAPEAEIESLRRRGVLVDLV